jgi:hypothetical protein
MVVTAAPDKFAHNFFIFKNGFTLEAANDHMVQLSRRIYSGLAGHGDGIIKEKPNVNISPTLYIEIIKECTSKSSKKKSNYRLVKK